MSGMFGIDVAPAVARVPVVRWPMDSTLSGLGRVCGRVPRVARAGNPGLVDSIPLGLGRGYVVEWRGAKRTHERQRRSIIQPRVVSFQRNYLGSIPPNQTASPERVESHASGIRSDLTKFHVERRVAVRALSFRIFHIGLPRIRGLTGGAFHDQRRFTSKHSPILGFIAI